MNPKTSIAAAAFLALVLVGSSAHAFGNACKNVNFSVDNHFDAEIEVQQFDFWSRTEGRWLTENFANTKVGPNKQDAIVQENEDIQYAERDDLTEIKVHYKILVDEDEDGPGEWISRTWTDRAVTDPTCFANRWYNADVGPED
jgi:hypothetical protein